MDINKYTHIYIYSKYLHVRPGGCSEAVSARLVLRTHAQKHFKQSAISGSGFLLPIGLPLGTAKKNKQRGRDKQNTETKTTQKKAKPAT